MGEKKNGKLPKARPRGKQSLEVIIERLQEISDNPDDYRDISIIEYSGQINNNKTKLRCNVCGNEWRAKVGPIINRKTGCPECAKKIGAKKVSQAKRLPAEEVIQRLKEITDDINDHRQIELVWYSGAATRVQSIFRCLICDHEWPAFVSSITSKNRHGCPNCAKEILSKSRRMSEEEVRERIKSISDDPNDSRKLELLEYTGKLSAKSLVKCLVCGHEWTPDLGNVLRSTSGTGCPECYKKVATDHLNSPEMREKTILAIIAARTIPKNEIIHKTVEKLSRETEIRNIEMLEYGGKTHTDALWKCNVCGYIWPAMWYSVFHDGNGCPNCNIRSSGEDRICKFLDNSGIKYVREYSPEWIGRYRYDFYIPEFNLIIEFMGEQHYEFIEFFHKTREFFEERQRIDELKYKEALNRRYNFLIIPYTEFDEIESILADMFRQYNQQPLPTL